LKIIYLELILFYNIKGYYKHVNKYLLSAMRVRNMRVRNMRVRNMRVRNMRVRNMRVRNMRVRNMRLINGADRTLAIRLMCKF